MFSRRCGILICVFMLLSGGCGGSVSTPTGPTRYDGQWRGTTSQGRPISFTVSADQKVTAITVGYNFGGCSGSSTFASLNLPIAEGPNPATSLGPGFGFGSGPPDGANYTQVFGSFSTSLTASGTVAFGAFTGCGNAVAIWTASKD